jgi:hypothetical protein
MLTDASLLDHSLWEPRPRQVVHPDLISCEGVVMNSHFVDGAVGRWSNTGSSPRLPHQNRTRQKC